MAGRKVFALFGVIGLEGAKGVFDQLNAIDKTAKKLSQELMKTGRQVETLGKKLTVGFTAPIVAAGTVVAVMTTKLGEMADQLLDLKDITGLSTDTLQELQHVSKQTGTNFESFVGIISKFSNKIPEIEKGGTSAATAFSKLGVPLKDSNGQIRDMNELFFDMLDGLRNVENVTSRNALAQDIFGKSLEEVAPMLSLSTYEMQAMRKEAHTLGLVMSEESIVSADNMRASIEQVKEQFAAAGRSIAVLFLPVLKDSVLPLIRESVIPAIKDMADKVKGAVDWFNNLSPTTKDNALKFIAITAALGPMLIVLGNVMKAIAGLRATILLLNAAMLANPYTLIATALAGLAIAAYASRDAFKSLNEEMSANNTEKVKGNLEEITYELMRMNESADAWESVEAFNAANERINTLRKNLADLGVFIEGDYSQMFIQAYDKLNELNGKASPSQPSGDGSGIRERTEEELKLESDLFEMKDKLQKEEFERKKAIREKNTQEVQRAESELMYWQKSKMLEMAELDVELNDSVREENLRKDQEAADLMHNKQMQYIEEEGKKRESIKNLVIDGIYQALDVFKDVNANQQMELDISYAKEKERIIKSVLSESEKQKKLQQLEEQTAKKKRQLNRKAAVIEKVTGIFSVGISTAAAIMKAYKDLGPIGGTVAAILVGALGAAQTAVIAAKPLPEAEKGAFLPGSAEGTALIAGEKRKPEIILPLDIGVGKLASALVGKISSMATPTSNGMLSAAGAGGGGMTMNVNVGNFIGNKAALREFEQVVNGLRIERIDRRA